MIKYIYINLQAEVFFLNICVFGASSSIIDEKYISDVEELGKSIAGRGHNLIFGAGASGLMGAVARGAYEKGGNIVGVVPDFFKDDDMGVDGRLFKNCTEIVITESMRERKRIMEERSDAFIITPGGIGTYEEFFEVFTLKQLGRHNKPIAIYNLYGYYDAMLKMLEESTNRKFLRAACSRLIEIFTDADEMLDYIENYIPEKINVFDTKNIEKD